MLADEVVTKVPVQRNRSLSPSLLRCGRRINDPTLSILGVAVRSPARSRINTEIRAEQSRSPLDILPERRCALCARSCTRRHAPLCLFVSSRRAAPSHYIASASSRRYMCHFPLSNRALPPSASARRVNHALPAKHDCRLCQAKISGVSPERSSAVNVPQKSLSRVAAQFETILYRQPRTSVSSLVPY